MAVVSPDVRETRVQSRRLILRPPRRGDFTAWADLRETDRPRLEPVEPLWPADALSREDWDRRLRAWQTGWRNDRAYVFLIFALRGGGLLGGVSLTHVRRGPAQAASLGYWLGQHAEGNGFMTEAVAAVSDWAKTELSLMRIEAATLPENTRSQDVLRRVGFEREGFARAYLEIAGQRRDHVLFGLVLE